jgi:hypothetical protein
LEPQGDKHFLPSQDETTRAFLTDNFLVSAVVTDLSTSFTKPGELQSLLGHEENCHWTMHEMRKDFIKGHVGPLNGNRTKPRVEREADAGEDQEEDCESVEGLV